MTWSKLSDDFSDDCWTLSDVAFRLHVEGLVWNGRKLLDLRLPKADVPRFARHPQAVAELVACGWWSDCGDHYVIRHHASYQRSRDAVVKQQEANARNGAKGGRPPRREQAADLKAETQSVSEPLSESKTERDRTGQGFEGSESPDDASAREWPPVRRPGSRSAACVECGLPLDPALGSSETHPACGAA